MLLEGQSDNTAGRPLASRMRPRSIDEFVGQSHLTQDGGLIHSILDMDVMPSLILYGPPGTGKTSLSYILSRHFKAEFVQINAVLSNIKELRAELFRAETRLERANKKTVLFIDEIQRFNAVQQEAMLPFVEKGVVSLIGASVENPMFAVVPALVSRVILVELKRLDEDSILSALRRALDNRDVSRLPDSFDIEESALRRIAYLSDGDLRKAYNLLELVSKANAKATEEDVIRLAGRKAVVYDRKGDNHYDNISAFIKAMRNGNEDDAIYWLAKMLYSGEDPRFIARRIVIFASEDVGLALPGAMAIAQSVFESVSKIGMPEARIILSNATIYMCRAKKSRYSYEKIEEAMSRIEKEISRQAPKFKG